MGCVEQLLFVFCRRESPIEHRNRTGASNTTSTLLFITETNATAQRVSRQRLVERREGANRWEGTLYYTTLSRDSLQILLRIKGAIKQTMERR